MAGNRSPTIATRTHDATWPRSPAIDSIKSHRFKFSPCLHNTLSFGRGLWFIRDGSKLFFQLVNQILCEDEATIQLLFRRELVGADIARRQRSQRWRRVAINMF